MRHRLERKSLTQKVKHIKQLLSLGIEGDKLLTTLMEQLHELIPSSSNTFVHINHNYEVVNIYDDSPEISQHVVSYKNHFMPLIGQHFHPKWGDWIKASNNITSNNGFVYKDFYQSEYYSDFMRPLKKHDSLIAPVKHSNMPYGALLLTRSDKDAKFTRYEKNALRSLLPHIANCFAIKHEDQEQFDTSHSGMLIFNLQLKLVHASSDALSVIKHISQGNSIRKAYIEEVPEELITFVRNYIRLCQTGEGVAALNCRLNTRWYIVECRANWLATEHTDETALVAVTLTKRIPRNIKIWHHNRHLGLTNKQWSVVFLALKGMTHDEIARTLKMSYYTVLDHMKIIFTKAGVSNRTELLSSLLKYRN